MDLGSEVPQAITPEERTLFQKLSWRLWAIGLGLCVVAAGTATEAHLAFAAIPLDVDGNAAELDREEEGYYCVMIAVWAILAAFRTLRTAMKASRATRLQTDARSAMFGLLSDLTDELKWLSFFLCALVVGVVVVFVLIAGVSLG